MNFNTAAKAMIWSVLASMIAIVLIVGTYKHIKTAAIREGDVISARAANFEISRVIQLHNLEHNTVIATARGYCHVDHEPADHRLNVICRVSENRYTKQSWGLGPNVTWSVEQLCEATLDAAGNPDEALSPCTLNGF